jgi:hypothetical protein
VIRKVFLKGGRSNDLMRIEEKGKLGIPMYREMG